MSRLSFRPRPVDFQKKLPIIRSIKEFEDDEAPATGASTRNSQLPRFSADTDNEVHHISSKKISSVIPTPQYNVVDTYERDYTCTFSQSTSYLRGRGARGEIGEFVEYDLDNEDEDWLQEFNNEKRILSPEKFEALLFKLEVLDHKTRERAGIMPTFGVHVPVHLQLDTAAEALQTQSVRFAIFHSVYNYWKAKREQWQKPILRLLQTAPPASDTNPYNTFRPREKAHRLHTRRMQRRENNVQSFEKLRQVRRNLDQAKTLYEALIKREEKKREVMESEVSLQRIQIKYKHEAQLIEDGMIFSGFPSNSFKFESSDDDFMDSDDCTYYPRAQSATKQSHAPVNSRLVVVPTGCMKRELKHRIVNHRWPDKKVLCSHHQFPKLKMVQLPHRHIASMEGSVEEEGSSSTDSAQNVRTILHRITDRPNQMAEPMVCTFLFLLCFSRDVSLGKDPVETLILLGAEDSGYWTFLKIDLCAIDAIT